MQKSNSIRNWELTRDIASIVGALTSVTVIWAIVYNNVAEALGLKWVAALFAGATVLGALFIVDFGLRSDLGYGFDLLFSGKAWKNWRLSAFLVLLLGFNLIRSAVTITLSWQGRVDVVNAVTKAPELEDVAGKKSALDQSSTQKLAGLQTQITHLERSIQRSEAAAGSAALRKLAASGNGWAKSELAKARVRASRADRAQLAQLREVYATTAASDAQAASVAVSALASENDLKVNRYKEISSRNMAYLGYFGAGCTFIVILVSLMLSLLNTADQDAPTYYHKYNVANANTATVAAKKIVRSSEQIANTTPPTVAETAQQPTLKAHYTDYKPTPQIRNLQRAIAVYNQRALAGRLTEKGAATLAAKKAELKRLKKQ